MEIFKFQNSKVAKGLHVVIASLSEAIHGATSGKVDCFVARAHRNDVKTRLRDLAECFFREVFIYSRPLRIEGAGNAGRPMRPIAACALVDSKMHTR
jgi:hypothetical protein